MWKCPLCQSLFVSRNDTHECSGLEPFTINGEIPNGGPGPLWDPALTLPLAPGDALIAAMQLTLTLTGTRDGVTPAIDNRKFDRAIVKYRPTEKFVNVTDLDRTDYAGRAALRILNQAFRERLGVPGRFSRHSDVKLIGNALYERIKGLPAKEGSAHG